MERGTRGRQRPGRQRGFEPPGDLIALGSKSAQSGSDSTDSRSSNVHKFSSLHVSSSQDRKRDGDFFLTKPTSPKRLKKEHGSITIAKDVPQEEIPLSPIDIDPSAIVDTVLQADPDNDRRKISAIICGTLAKLNGNRVKPSPACYMALLYLAKEKSIYFTASSVFDALVGIISRDVQTNIKAKGNVIVPVMACNILMFAYADDDCWPERFIQVYIQDALGERLWVDNEMCKSFVQNILTVFDTQIPAIDGSTIGAPTLAQSTVSQPTAGMTSTSQSMTVSENGTDKSSEDKGNTNITTTEAAAPDCLDTSVRPRYDKQSLKDSIRDSCLQSVDKILTQRQSTDSVPRQLLKFLVNICCYPRVRLIAAQKIELWLQNPKLTRHAQHLLMTLALNCNYDAQYNEDCIAYLIKMKLKTKPLTNHQVACIKELIGKHSKNVGIVLKHAVCNELSSTQTSFNTSNMMILSSIFNSSTVDVAKYLGIVFIDLLINKEDLLNPIKTLLRELLRITKSNFDFYQFSSQLLDHCLTNAQQIGRQTHIKQEEILYAVIDLLTYTMMLSVFPLPRDITTKQQASSKIQQQIASIQRYSVWWLHTTVLNVFTIHNSSYMKLCLYKVLFRNSIESYVTADNWPSELERSQVLELCTNVPVEGESILCILLISENDTTVLPPYEAFDLIRSLLTKAAQLDNSDYLHLKFDVDYNKLISTIFSLSLYQHSTTDSATVPAQKSTDFAYSDLYWKGCLLIVILSAFNLDTVGMVAWEEYPTLKCLMEMVMTGNYSFPPLTSSVIDSSDNKLAQIQLAQAEKDDIVAYENTLFSGTSKGIINEKTSSLLPQLMRFNPQGPARCPADYVSHDLQKVNLDLSLGRLLCSSRSPDFLLDIIQRQGSAESMPWLAQLVSSNFGSVEGLPVQCLCEFLLHCDVNSSEELEYLDKKEHFAKELHSIVFDLNAEVTKTIEIFESLFRRIASNQQKTRLAAIKALALIISESENNNDDVILMNSMNSTLLTLSSFDSSLMKSYEWLLVQLSSIPHFKDVRELVCTYLKQACMIETDMDALAAYVIFLSIYSPTQQPDDAITLAIDMCSMIMQRYNIINKIICPTKNRSAESNIILSLLLTMFAKAIKVMIANDDDYSFKGEESTKHWVSVKFTGNDEFVHIPLVVMQAVAVLLTYEPLPRDTGNFAFLLDLWFPADGDLPEVVYDMDEEGIVWVDPWLKSRMIMSYNSRLVDKVLESSTPDSLIPYVQSFGIPVENMSKILEFLDNCVQDDYIISDQTVDSGRTVEFINSHVDRGAHGGGSFLTLLAYDAQLDSVSSTSSSSSSDTSSSASSNLQIDFSPKDSDQMEFTNVLNEAAETDDMDITVEDEMMDVAPDALQKLKGELMLGISMTEKQSSLFSRTLDSLSSIMQSEDSHSFFENCSKRLFDSWSIIKPVFIQEKLLASEDVSLVLKKILTHLQQVADSGDFWGSVKRHVTKRRKMLPSGIILRKSIEDECGQQFCRLAVDSVTSDKVESNILSPNCLAPKLLDILFNKDLDENTVINRNFDLSKLFPEHRKSSYIGLGIDWYQVANPEIVNVFDSKSKQALFSSVYRERKEWQLSLLSLVIHQSHWRSLQSCINWLLIHDSPSDLDSTAVLDFLRASISSPRIWQGCSETAVIFRGRIDTQAKLLTLRSKNLLNLAIFVVNEAKDLYENSTQETINEKLRDRTSLLVACCNNDAELLSQLASSIYSSMRKEDRTVVQLLGKLYLASPEIINVIPSNAELFNSTLEDSSLGKLDVTCHYIISSLASTHPGKACLTRLENVNLLCRSLAIKHPAILIRQLPIIYGLLQGRIQLNYDEFHNRNHHYFFLYILNTLDLLRPFVFVMQAAKSPLRKVLETFFKMIQTYYIHDNSKPDLVSRFVEFLHAYFIFDGNAAVGVLQSHCQILKVISERYPDLSLLKSLLIEVNIDCSYASHGDAELSSGRAIEDDRNHDNSKNANKNSITQQQPGTTQLSRAWSSSMLSIFINRLSSYRSTEDLLKTLRELDEVSRRRPDVLEHFYIHLTRLVFHLEVNCRSLAHTLILRYIKSNPRTAPNFSVMLMECLDSDMPDVVASAVYFAPEYISLIGDHCDRLLLKLFQTGIYCKADSRKILLQSIKRLSFDY